MPTNTHTHTHTHTHTTQGLTTFAGQGLRTFKFKLFNDVNIMLNVFLLILYKMWGGEDMKISGLDGKYEWVLLSEKYYQ